MKPLRIAILSHEPSNTVSNDLMPAAEKRGHTLCRIDLAALTITPFFDDPHIANLLTFDIVYYRTTGLEPTIPFLLSALLQKNGIPFINGVMAHHPHMVRKTYQTALASAHGVVTPRSRMDANAQLAPIADVLGLPFIAKADISSQGRDVHRIDSEKAFSAVPPLPPGNAYLYQSYIPHRSDCRVHILGPRAVAAYRRLSPEGDFRTNVSQGGKMEPVPPALTKTLFAMGEQVNTIFGLDIAAVDFIEGEDGVWYFSEINTNPGWEIADRHATGVNMSECVLDYLEGVAA